MPAKIKLSGTPKTIRKQKLDGNTVYCLDFVEGGKSNSPKGLPPVASVATTVLINEKQWRKHIEKEKQTPFLLIEGEVTLDVPISILKGEFAVVAFKVEKAEKKETVKSAK